MGFLSKTWNKFHVGVFVDACRHGDERQALSMLQGEPELAYAKDKRGISALFLAVANGNNAIVEAILNITNQPNDVEPDKGFTPLLLATNDGRIALTRILLDHGADGSVTLAANCIGDLP